MKEKKTAVMTVRIPPSTKAVIEAEAEKHDWTPSKLAEKILTDWAQKNAVNDGVVNFSIQNNENIYIGG